MTAIDAVLFDMDGVLYAYDFENRLTLLEAALDVPAATIRARVFEAGIEDGADAGALSTDAYIAAISDALGVEVRLGQWLAARKWAMAPDPAMIDLAGRLKARVPVAMLTNNGTMLAEHIAELAPELPPLFGDNLFVSAVFGGGKEDPATFSRLLDRLGWRADRTLFVDDNEDYVAAATRAGLITHHFSGLDALVSALVAAGLLDG